MAAVAVALGGAVAVPVDVGGRMVAVAVGVRVTVGLTVGVDVLRLMAKVIELTGLEVYGSTTVSR